MCYEDFYTLKEDGTCEFNGCENGEKIIEYCSICKIGYEIDPSDGICVGYDGSKDIPSPSSSSSSFSSSSYSENNRIELFLFFFILAMLIQKQIEYFLNYFYYYKELHINLDI